MDKELEPGDRVHVEGWAHPEQLYVRGFGTLRAERSAVDVNRVLVSLDYASQGVDRTRKTWLFDKGDVTPLHPKGGECKQPAEGIKIGDRVKGVASGRIGTVRGYGPSGRTLRVYFEGNDCLPTQPEFVEPSSLTRIQQVGDSTTAPPSSIERIKPPAEHIMAGDPIGPKQVIHCFCGRAEPCRHHPSVAPDTDRSAPLAILARAAEECLQYHVAVEARDDDDVDDVVELLTVGNLRNLVEQGKREWAI